MARSGWIRLLACAGMLSAGGLINLANAGDWTRFRGPNGTGIADGTDPTPAKWSDKENVKWKIPLPGAGVSCPIVVGNKVLVTCYSGYGLKQEAPGDMKDLVRHLVCIDKATGKTLWKKDVPSTVEEDPYRGAGVPQHGYASHTPTSDGTNVYVFFGKSGVMAFSLEGEKLWECNVGKSSDDRQWGSASSPIVHDNTVVVPAGPEGRALVGLDKKTGKELWKLDSDKLGSVWGTPALVNTANGAELVFGVPGEIWGIDPKTGKVTWTCKYLDQGDQFSSSVVVDGEVVYAIEGRGGGSVAVKAGGKDDVTKSNTVWKERDSGRFGSPVIYQGRLYNIANKKLTCVDAKTHEKIFEGRLKGMDGKEFPEPPAFGGGGGRGPGGRPGAGPPGAGGPPGERKDFVNKDAQKGEGKDAGRGGPPGGGRFAGGGGRGRGGFGGFGGIDYGSPVVATARSTSPHGPARPTSSRLAKSSSNLPSTASQPRPKISAPPLPSATVRSSCGRTNTSIVSPPSNKLGYANAGTAVSYRRN